MVLKNFNQNEDYFLRITRAISDPLIKPLSKIFTPNQISILSLIAYLSSGILISHNNLFFSAILIQVGLILDVLDGGVARHQKSSSDFGGWLDSFIDLVGHLFILFCLGIYLDSLLPFLLICVMFLSERLYKNEKSSSKTTKVNFYDISGFNYGCGVTRAILTTGLIIGKPYAMILFYTTLTSLMVFIGLLKKLYQQIKTKRLEL